MFRFMFRIFARLRAGIFWSGVLMFAFAFIAAFANYDINTWFISGCFMGLIFGFVSKLIPDCKCPNCNSLHYKENCKKGSEYLSSNILPNTFTDDESIEMGMRIYFLNAKMRIRMVRKSKL